MALFLVNIVRLHWRVKSSGVRQSKGGGFVRSGRGKVKEEDGQILPKPMIHGMAQNKHVMISAETLMNLSAFFSLWN